MATLALPSPATLLCHRWAPAVLTLAAFLLSLWVQHTIYPGLSWNRDEPVFLWHVEVLRAGQLTTPDGARPSLFLPWLSAARDGELFSQYTLGWPLALLVGALLGSPDLAIAFGAALAVSSSWALARELFDDRLVASVTALLMLTSPILAVQGGTHLNYLFTLGLGLLFCTALLSGVRLASGRRLLGAGVLLGWILFTRPFDAVVWGALAVAYLAVVHRGQWRAHLRRAPWLAAGFLPFVAATLLLNLRLTGRIGEFPITLADPLDKFGFGDRRLMPRFGIVPYGRREALTSAGRNAWWLPFFLVGAHLGVVLAVAGAWINRRHRSTLFLLVLGLAFPLSYFPFFGTHISSLTARLSGPIYYIPAYFPLCALMAVALVRLSRRHAQLGMALVGVLVLISVPLAASRLLLNQELSRNNLPWARSIDDIRGRALVVVSPTPYLLFLNPYAINGPDLDRDILYAADSGPQVLDLVEEMPDRTAYLQRSTVESRELSPSEDPRTPEIVMSRLHLERGERVELDVRAAAAVASPVTVSWIEVEGGRSSPARSTSDGRVEASWDLVPYTGTTSGSTFRVPRGLRTVHVLVGWGDTVAAARRNPAVRRTYYVRSTADEITVLTPGTVFRYEHTRAGTSDERSWIEMLDSPSLKVQLTALPA